jgi:hypothetical protein
MLMRLSDETVSELQTIMAMTGRTNYKHTLQTLVGQVLKNLRRNEMQKAVANNNPPI